MTAISNMMSSPYLGKLGDKIGKEKILIASLIASVAVFFATAFVKDVYQLLFLRFLLGFCTAGIVPTIAALIRIYTPKGKEGKAFGYNSSLLSLGNMLGPIVVGALSGVLSYRGVFVFVAGMLVVNVIISSRLLTKNKETTVRDTLKQ